MSDTTEQFPRKVLFAAAALIAFTISAAATARWSGLGATREAEAATQQVLELRFDDRADGAVAIYHAGDGRLVDVLPPGTNGFVRIVMRSLARERRSNDHDRTTPFRLVRWADGRLSVEDPATRRHIDLGAFGAVNTQAFARLMLAGETDQ
jgi:putative photosynthetic complex assembly protein